MIQKIGHIILSFIMLLATVGITVSKQYCKDELQKHYFTNANKSSEHLTMNSIHENCNQDADCCHTDTVNIQLCNYYMQENKFEIHANSFSISSLYTLTNLYHINYNNLVNSQNIIGNFTSPNIHKPSLSSLQILLC